MATYKAKKGDYYRESNGVIWYKFGDGDLDWRDTGVKGNALPRVATGNEVDKDTKQLVSAIAAAIAAGNTLSIKLTNPTVPSKSASYRYPNNIKDKSTDYILFEFGDYIPPYKGDPIGAGEPVDRTKYKNYNLSANNFKPYPSSSDLKPVILYMPQDIQTESKQNWNGKAISNIGSAAGLGVLGAGNADRLRDYNVGEGLHTAVKALVTGALNAVPGVGGNFTLNDVLSTTQGLVLNPNVEVMYDSLELREFTLKFKMTPHDGPEAQTIRNITQVFRKASMPTYDKTYDGTTTNSQNIQGSNVIGVPSMCRVSFMRGSALHDWLPQYKTCVIQKVTVNYTPDGTYATFGDGSPVATELSVTFLESKLLFAEELNVSGVSY